MNKTPDFTSLVEEALKDHGKLRNIVSLLYHEDMAERLRAALALGEITRRDPELMLQRWQRIFRAFDDTMSCWGVAEALSEIARNMPKEHRGKLVNFLRGFKRDDCSCQGYIWGMCRICKIEGGRVNDFVPELLAFLDSQNICMRAQALWALGELERKEATERIRGFLKDANEVWIFEDDSAARKSIGTIAGEALKKMRAEQT
jgi:hypothetical protein